MEILTVENLTFTYPGHTVPALSDVCFTMPAGAFVTLCGKSGCGKTTLLRLLKPTLAPHGQTAGTIRFRGTSMEMLSHRVQAAEIGFVLQSPENQLVTDTVWHELAFGLENLGVPTAEIRARVAEMASFFGIQSWFHEKVAQLSGGQKQLLNLAAVMVMQPSLLLLDEPTSQLDPIAAGAFMQMLQKINRELGTAILLCEHRLEEAFAVSDRILVLDGGRVLADAPPALLGQKLAGHDMTAALPVPMRVFAAVDGSGTAPVTVREGRQWLERRAESLNPEKIPKSMMPENGETVLEVRDAFFRYTKSGRDVVKNLSVKVRKGEIFAILGGNGAGKTTALSIMAGLCTPYRGRVLVKGRRPEEIPDLYGGALGILPQNPGTLFTEKTVREALDVQSDAGAGAVADCGVEALLDRHPFDLSGGELQRAALAKVLAAEPEILLLDEPTKGMDAHFKRRFAGILKACKTCGVTVVLVSHDIEFCAAYADRCAMFFDGTIVSVDAPRPFFAGKSFYTTAANRMARAFLPEAVLASDIIAACGGVPEADPPSSAIKTIKKIPASAGSAAPPRPKRSPLRTAVGCVCSILFLLALFFGMHLTENEDWTGYAFQAVTILLPAAALLCFFPAKGRAAVLRPRRTPSHRTVAATIFALVAVPLTVLVGVYVFGDKKFYFISLLVILELMLPFLLAFEGRKPSAREILIISVLCALGVAGRAAFYMLPQFKPVAALIIIAGVAFGSETGFLVGAVTAFASNFLFGQGPWTPWQMFAFGLIGFLAGALSARGRLRTRVPLCIFGALATFVIYGGIVNATSPLLWEPNPSKELIFTSLTLGAPFDAIHALSTVFFLWFGAEPLLEKLERIKQKYGLIGTDRHSA